MSLQATEQVCAANAVAPRVSLTDIENAIAARFDTTADQAMRNAAWSPPATKAVVPELIDRLSVLSICVLIMRNGFTVIGKSAPASPENFNRELGIKLAYEDAIRQLWPLMGFALRDKLAGF